MIQTQTKILIKDNSDFLEGKCINYTPRIARGAATIGDLIKVTILKTKKSKSPISRSLNTMTGAKGKSSLQDLLIIQTKKPIYRKDGSTVKFDFNCGVCISFKGITSSSIGGGVGKKRLQLGFKRINTTTTLELKNFTRAPLQQFKGAYNLIKLSKGFV
jgi:large subunit ribosomal protein L14